MINSKRSKALHLFLTIACNHSASHRPEHLPFSRLHIEGRDADQSRAQSGTSPISPLPDRAYRKPGWASEAILWDDADDSPRDITEKPLRLSPQKVQLIRWINPTLRTRRLGFPIPNKKIPTPSAASLNMSVAPRQSRPFVTRLTPRAALPGQVANSLSEARIS